MTPEMGKINWSKTYYQLQNGNGVKTTLNEVILSNYLTKKQLEVGLDILSAFEEYYITLSGNTDFETLKSYLKSREHSSLTIHNTLRTLRRVGILSNTDALLRGKWKYTKSSLYGVWRLSWKRYANINYNFAELGEQKYSELFHKRRKFIKEKKKKNGNKI